MVEAVSGNHRMRRAPSWRRASATQPRQDEKDTGNSTSLKPVVRRLVKVGGPSRRIHGAERAHKYPWIGKSDSGSVGARLHQRVLTQRSSGIDQTAGFLVLRAAQGKSGASVAMKVGGMHRKREGNPWQGGQTRQGC